MNLVIIPAFNEEKTIGRVIRGLFEHGYKNILVVDDGSKDWTAKLAEDLGVTVLRHRVNRGQGAALETGDRYALKTDAEYVIHFDGDDQFDPSDIDEALRLMRFKNLDVLIGSRFLDKRSEIPFFKKYFLLPIARVVNMVFTGYFLTDAHNGFRILSRRALSKIKISQDRMAHNTEIIQQIKKFHLPFAEFPVKVKYHEYGQGMSGGVKIVSDLIVGWLSKVF